MQLRKRQPPATEAPASRAVTKANAGRDPKREVDLGFWDVFVNLNGTPLSVEDDDVPVGVEGLRQDWEQVGSMLWKAMDLVSLRER